MLFKDNPWSSKPRQQLRAKMYLKDIFISSSFETWISIYVGILLHLNEWWKDANHQDWLWNKDIPKGHHHIIILWNMVIDWCGHMVTFEWILKRCIPSRLTVEQNIPEGHFHIFILWNMAIDQCGHTIEYKWMAKRCTPLRLTVE
jgi:hypothetical protein